MKFVGGVFCYEAAGDDEDGTWCDWWLIEDLQYPLTRLSAAAGLPARRDHRQPDHDGRHAQGLLGPEGAPRGHGREPRRGVARVPELPALLRPDVRRAQGQGARRPLREGVQRLDVRRVVRGHQRPPHPADHRAALGREARGRRGPPQRGARLPRGDLLGDPAVPRPPVDARQGRLLGPVPRRRARRPTPSCACTSARRRRCRRRRPTRRPRSARRSRT